MAALPGSLGLNSDSLGMSLGEHLSEELRTCIYFVCAVLGMERRALYMLGKCSTTELQPSLELRTFGVSVSGSGGLRGPRMQTPVLLVGAHSS